MKILFVMDPIEKCDQKWDNSLRLLWEFHRRGHQNWTADSGDLYLEGSQIFARARHTKAQESIHRNRKRYHYSAHETKVLNLKNFDLILIRKDPPFDETYLYLTYVLERIADQVAIVNHPRAIRDHNEKLSTLRFPKWIPKTLVSSSPEAILDFQKHLKKNIVVKPLNLKSGKGVFRLKWKTPHAMSLLNRATHHGTKTLMAQEFIETRKGEKRIVLLNGKLLAVYEKRSRKNDFRANLSLGASFHKSALSASEKKLIADLKPFLLKEGLYFAGLDVLDGKLLEINVTSPAGVTEAIFLEPRLRLVEAWADFLEDFSRRFRK